MSKRAREDMNLYHFNNGQEETIDDMMKRKKAKERERRVEQKKAHTLENEFDFDTETVIGMTNKNRIKNEEQKRKEFAKKQRKRNKKLRIIKNILKFILFVGLISGAIAFATCSPIFNISEIDVINNNKLSSDTIISLSEISKDENIFKFLSSKAEEKIKQNAYVESVKIKRIIPNKVQIQIEEREPKFCIPILGQYAYINTQGYILEIAQNELNLPAIYGMSTAEENIVAGNRLNEDDLNSLENILKIMSVMKDNELYDKVTNIDISNKNDYSIYMQEEKKTIHLGDTSNLSNKMLYIIAILDKEKDVEGDIYANGDLNKNFKVYFREKLT